MNVTVACAPCARQEMDRAAVAEVMGVPMCGACSVEAKATGERLVAHVEADAPAKVTRQLRVPEMPPRKGDGCCWGCQPDAVIRECAVHGRAYVEA